MNGRTRRVTIRNVAEDANVSVAAVSKVLRRSYGVSDAMREKVEASIKRLGYRPHMAARGLRGKTYTVGVVQNDLRNPYLPNIFDGIFEGFDGTGYQPLLGVGQSQEPLETALINAMIDRQMDGLIMIGPRLPSQRIDTFARQVPTCVLAHHCPEEQAFDTANFDDQMGARLAVSHLVEQGCRRVVMLSQALPEPGTSDVIRQRELGFRQGLKHHGFDASSGLLHYGEFDPGATEAVIRDLLTKGNQRPDGLFCWSDMVALQVFEVARELGIRVPDELAVVGFDNTFDDRLRPVGLSSLNQSGHQLGLEAARLLLERIEGRAEPVHTLYEPVLVVRSSSRRRAT